MCRVGVSEAAALGGGRAGVENQNTRSGRSAVRSRRQMGDSATVTTHPKVGPYLCAVLRFSKADWPALGGGEPRSYSWTGS